MLAPRSYSLRSSLTNWSLLLLSFFIGASPRTDTHLIPNAGSVDTRSSQLDQVTVVVGPEVLGAVGQQHDALRIQGLRRPGIMGHQHHRPQIAAERVENLFA